MLKLSSKLKIVSLMRSLIETDNASNAMSSILAVQSALMLLSTLMMNLLLTHSISVSNVRLIFKSYLRTRRLRLHMCISTLPTGLMNGSSKAVDTLTAEKWTIKIGNARNAIILSTLKKESEFLITLLPQEIYKLITQRKVLSKRMLISEVNKILSIFSTFINKSSGNL